MLERRLPVFFSRHVFVFYFALIVVSMKDMVEAAIGEAFEASLRLGLERGSSGGGGREPVSSSSPAGPQRFAGGHRSVRYTITRGEMTEQK